LGLIIKYNQGTKMADTISDSVQSPLVLGFYTNQIPTSARFQKFLRRNLLPSVSRPILQSLPLRWGYNQTKTTGLYTSRALKLKESPLVNDTILAVEQNPKIATSKQATSK